MFKIGPIFIALTTIAGVVFAFLSGGAALVAVDNFIKGLLGISLGVGGLGWLLIAIAVVFAVIILLGWARSHV